MLCQLDALVVVVMVVVAVVVVAVVVVVVVYIHRGMDQDLSPMGQQILVYA
jgi:preprotein translocase subunit SecG